MGIMKKDPFEAELRKVEKIEARRKAEAKKVRSGGLLLELEAKIPPKAHSMLKAAFCKAFSTIFVKGIAVIEKSFNKDSIKKDYEIREFAVNIKGSRKEIKKHQSEVRIGNMRNMALSAVEGVGLGALGVGLPDIVLFVGVILKGVYETALKYGYDYDALEERLFILKLLEASMQQGEEWIRLNDDIDAFIQQREHSIPMAEDLEKQIEKTSDAFSTEMLVMKFIQGIPVVGIIGGATNPVYYQKIMRYVQLKYRKRYLMGKLKEEV